MGYIREWTSGDRSDCSEHWKVIWDMKEMRCDFRPMSKPTMTPAHTGLINAYPALRVRSGTAPDPAAPPLPLGPLAGAGSDSPSLSFSLPFACRFPLPLSLFAFFCCPFETGGFTCFLRALAISCSDEDDFTDIVDNAELASSSLSPGITLAFFFFGARVRGELSA